MPVVVDHFGSPDLDDDSIAAWRRSLARLARLDQVVLKLSGIVQLQRFAADWNVGPIGRLLDAALDTSGRIAA